MECESLESASESADLKRTQRTTKYMRVFLVFHVDLISH
jgi:hypothetical protein